MRRSVRFSLALIAVLACVAAPAGAQTVDEIVAKNIQSKGGLEKWKSIQTMKLTGKVNVQGMDLPLTIIAKRPNMMRQEMTLPAPPSPPDQKQPEGQKVVQAYDGSTAWMINPMLGSAAAQPLTGPSADTTKDQADFDGVLVDYKAKGNAVELVGREKVGDRDVFHLKVTKKNGQVQQFFLDADTGRDLQTTVTIDQGGQPATLTSELSDYREVNGIMVPHLMKQILNGTPVAQMTIEKVEFNLPVEDTIFRMPVVK